MASLLADARMALAAGFSEVCGVHRRARIARPQDRMDAMAGSAVGGGQRAFAHSQAVEAVSVGWQAIGGQIVEPGHTGIGVASSAGLRGDVCRVQRGHGVTRFKNQLFPVAIGAVRCVAHTRFQRFAVDTFVELPGDFIVTPGAGPYERAGRMRWPPWQSAQAAAFLPADAARPCTLSRYCSTG
jgi:hypothetical protein